MTNSEVKQVAENANNSPHYPLRLLAVFRLHKNSALGSGGTNISVSAQERKLIEAQQQPKAPVEEVALVAHR